MFDESREPDEIDAIGALMDSRLAELNTCLPGVIVKWDASRPHVADVQPTIQRVYVDDDGNEQALDQPVITDVPVAWPQGGGFVLTFPLKAGDVVELRFAQRSLDKWLASDGKTPHDCGDNRRFNLSDAIVYPGLGTQSFAAASADAVMLAAKDDSVHLKITPGGEVQLKAGAVRLGTDDAGKALAIAAEVRAELDDIRSALTNHTHLGNAGAPTSPMATSVPPTVLPPARNLASGKVFTDA